MRRYRLWVLILFLLSTGLVQAQEFKPTTVILVRHAEKQSNTEDPDLSEAGRARASELARVLGSSGIRAIYTSQYLRTKKTAMPLAAALKLVPVEVNADKTSELIKRIFAEHSGDIVLVVGHSDTVPEIISALGASVPAIDDTAYDNLYVVTATARGKATVTRLKFGAKSKE